MQKYCLALSLSLSVFLTNVFACGGITHMYLAEQSIARLSPAPLRNLLHDNLNEYLVGAYYPDSGYIKGTGYGEISHWDPFIFAFADYLRATYQDPIHDNPRLVAFLFGVASHRVSDENAHSIFYRFIRDHDFPNDGARAHRYGDFGIDVLLTVDKSQWINEPFHWWIPTDDLLAIYARMGHPEVTANQILLGTSSLEAANFSEHAIAPAAYTYMRYEMPWTAAHYLDWPEGGLNDDITKISVYQEKLWQYLQGNTSSIGRY